MKKLFALIMSAVLLLCVAGCGSAEKKSKGKSAFKIPKVSEFSVGYARREINPDYSVPIGGYGNTATRMSTGNFDYIYTTVIAVSDENNNTVLLTTVDVGNFATSFADVLRDRMCKETGLKKDNIMVNCTHTHSAPDLWSTGNYYIQKFMTDTAAKTAEAAIEAIKDRKPAKMFVGAAQSDNMNFVRRYKMSDGSYGGDNFGDFTNAHIVDYETEADHNIRMIKFTRDGGKDILMTNYQVHGTVGSSNHNTERIFYEISPDFIGSFRRSIETTEDCLVAYYLGGAGNINPSSRLLPNAVTNEQSEYGTKLAQFVIDAYPTAFKEAKTGEVKTAASTVVGTVNHTEDGKLAHANQLVALYTAPNATENSAAISALAKSFGIESQHHANQIVTKAALGKTLKVNLNAVKIGSVGIATAPYEMFDTDANKIRDNTDYDMTFVMGYSNGYLGYMPDSEAYSHGGYEQYSCRFIKGESDKFVDELKSMLKELK